jgi:antitoxin (DNA-binding transcriptional repressor) of toxin-antitoxin stability system
MGLILGRKWPAGKDGWMLQNNLQPASSPNRVPQHTLFLQTEVSQTRLIQLPLEIVMQSVNMLQAKSSLSRLVDAIEQGQEREIIIARNGRPAAKLVPIDRMPDGQRIGVAKGMFEVPDDIDVHNEEVARLFMGGDRS